MGLLCTEGFRDTLEIRLGYREARYDLTNCETPPPLVPRHLRLPVRERIDRDGEVLIPLHREDVDRAAGEFERHHVGRDRSLPALVVSQSRARAPGPASCSPNGSRGRRSGCRRKSVRRSGSTSARARRWSTATSPRPSPPTRVGSRVFFNRKASEGRSGTCSPTADWRGAASCASDRWRRCSRGRLPVRPPASCSPGSSVTAVPSSSTWGGTSFDGCLVTDGQPETRSVFTVGGHRVRSPAISVETIGAGGGSIATVERGLLAVGPGSAGADPGPACYGRGGTHATVTDANLILGYINPEALLGGALALRSERAVEAVRRHVAGPLGLSVERAALGIFEVVNRNMADALRAMTLGIGRDPRDYVLVVGGGAGPVHAGMLARMVGIRRVIVPRVSAELCAFGGLVCNPRHDYRRSCASRVEHLDPARLAGLLEEMEQEGRDELHREGAAPEDIAVSRVLDMRYRDQTHETPVDVSDLDLDEEPIPALLTRFHDAYHDLYRYTQRDPGLRDHQRSGHRDREGAPRPLSSRSRPPARHSRRPLPARDRSACPIRERRSGFRSTHLPRSARGIPFPDPPSSRNPIPQSWSSRTGGWR